MNFDPALITSLVHLTDRMKLDMAQVNSRMNALEQKVILDFQFNLTFLWILLSAWFSFESIFFFLITFKYWSKGILFSTRSIFNITIHCNFRLFSNWFIYKLVWLLEITFPDLFLLSIQQNSSEKFDGFDIFLESKFSGIFLTSLHELLTFFKHHFYVFFHFCKWTIFFFLFL